jgi:hypothetical protein
MNKDPLPLLYIKTLVIDIHIPRRNFFRLRFLQVHVKKAER